MKLEKSTLKTGKSMLKYYRSPVNLKSSLDKTTEIQQESY